MKPPLRLLAILASAALLAGCLVSTPSPPDEEGNSTVLPPPEGQGDPAPRPPDPSAQPPPPSRPTTGGGVERLTGYRGFEPTLAISPNGTLYVTALSTHGSLPRSPSTILRSTDGGRSWADVGPSLPTGHAVPPYTGDPLVHYDEASGRLFLVDAGYPYGGANCLWLRLSDDEGATWTHSRACGGGVHDHPTVVTAKPRVLQTVNYPTIFHYCVNRLVDTACGRSLDGGLTFGPLRPLVFTDPAHARDDPEGEAARGFCATLTGPLAASADGTLYLGAACPDGPPEVAISEDDGLTWRRATIAPEERVGPASRHEVAIAVDTANVLYALWIGGGLPRLATSTDRGATWSAPVTVSPPGVTAADFPTIAAGSAGRVALAYLGTSIPGGYEGRAFGDDAGIQEEAERDWAGATWLMYLSEGAVSPSGLPVLETVSTTAESDPVARGHCGGSRCDHGRGSGGGATSDVHGIGDFIRVAVDANGRAWVAYVDTCSEACASDPDARFDRDEGAIGTIER